MTSPPANDGDLLSERHLLTELLYAAPYDLVTYLERAATYRGLGYPDLAAGDAYRALLLTDEALDESGEFHEQALESLRERTSRAVTEGPEDVRRSLNRNLHIGDQKSSSSSDHEESDVESLTEFARGRSFQCYQLLAQCLLDTGCLRSSYEFCTRGLQVFGDDSVLQGVRKQILDSARAQYGLDEPLAPSSLPNEGLARRELYPWNTKEPDRFSESSLNSLNEALALVAPKCSARVTELPLLHTSGDKSPTTPATVRQLGLFAIEDIAPGEVFLREKSLLTGSNRLDSATCDACSAKLPSTGSESTAVSCPECYDVVFCSETCLDLAQTSYHPALCGNDALASIGRDVPRTEAAEALYLLLLERAIAMAETQEVHPLELNETKFIWGDFVPVPAPGQKAARGTLPFDFPYTVELPLNILLQLDLDPFAPENLEKYDTWVLNTLYAKFRGVASAKFDPEQPTKGPVVCAVYPLWCLANHSCDPNVGWAWGEGHQEDLKTDADVRGEQGDGGIVFWARKQEERVLWVGKRREGGLKKGEEVFSHYCDIALPVKARREWAQGALGGDCICERCVWEASQGEDEAYSSPPILGNSEYIQEKAERSSEHIHTGS